MALKPFSFIKNLDTGVILPWHSGFEGYKDLNFEPYFGPLPGGGETEESAAPAPAPQAIAAIPADFAAIISGLQAQLKQLQDQNALLAAAPEKTSDEIEAVRIASIKQAIAKVDVTSYANAQGGFPSQPKVNDIKVLTGFNDVSREEIQAAML
jgi:hypothetical protein